MIAARTMPRMTATAARMRSPSTPATAAPEAASTLSRGRGRQVEEDRDDGQDRRDDRRDVEALVDRGQRVLARLHPRDEHADDRGDRADSRDDQREDEALGAEGDRAEDQRGDQRDRIRLEEVGGHAGAVADVVADVVRDRGRVARVVLRDARLDLADEVGADVGGLGEDAAADPHEHREQGRAEAEALEDLGSVTLVTRSRRRPRQEVRGPPWTCRRSHRCGRRSAYPQSRSPSRAAEATRTLALTASDMPR